MFGWLVLTKSFLFIHYCQWLHFTATGIKFMYQIMFLFFCREMYEVVCLIFGETVLQGQLCLLARVHVWTLERSPLFAFLTMSLPKCYVLFANLKDSLNL